MRGAPPAPVAPAVVSVLAGVLAAPIVLAGVAGCGGGGRGPGSRGEPVLADRARDGWEPPSTERSRAVVVFASRQVGKRYCWGGTGPSCFDCSGLVSRAWASVGVRLPHSSEAMSSPLSHVPPSQVPPAAAP